MLLECFTEQGIGTMFLPNYEGEGTEPSAEDVSLNDTTFSNIGDFQTTDPINADPLKYEWARFA